MQLKPKRSQSILSSQSSPDYLKQLKKKDHTKRFPSSLLFLATSVRLSSFPKTAKAVSFLFSHISRFMNPDIMKIISSAPMSP